MRIEGGCYCKKIRYVSEMEPEVSIQCHCRECMYITGGNPNVLMIVPLEGFKITSGTPKRFSRNDLDAPVERMFCHDCGTALGSYTPRRPRSVILKVGTFDDPSIFKPQVAIFACDKLDFHYIPDDVKIFSKLPE